MIGLMGDNTQVRAFLKEHYNEPVPDDFQAITSHSFVLGKYSPDLKGCFPCNLRGQEVEIHVAFHPDYRGDFAVESAKEAFKWLKENGYKRIVANISDPHIKKYAERCGMVRNGNWYEVI